MAKCSVCGNKVEELYLDKVKGTYVGKKLVCNECQKKYSMKEIKEKL